MKQLTEDQCVMLQKLMNRAIANGQLAIQFDSPNDDGNHCSSEEWRADLCEASYEDKPTQHEVCLMIDDRSCCFLAGVDPSR